jgi:hypothetical protein
MNQSPSDRKDRTGGGDVTKSSSVATPKADETHNDLLNAHAADHQGYDPTN